MMMMKAEMTALKPRVYRKHSAASSASYLSLVTINSMFVTS